MRVSEGRLSKDEVLSEQASLPVKSISALAPFSVVYSKETIEFVGMKT